VRKGESNVQDAKRFLVAALALFVMPAPAADHRGQVRFGGSPVPGVTVTLTRNGETVSAITSQDGVYVFPGLADGTWKAHLEMLGFAAIDSQITSAPGAPDAQWDLEMLPLGAIKAVVERPEPASTIKAGATPPAEPGKWREKPPSGKQEPPPATPFQRAQVKATAAAPAAADKDALSGQDMSELAGRAADGFLINGSSNNSANSTFSTPSAFGNNRSGARSLYNGSFGFVLDNSGLDARPYSLTGQNTPRASYNRFTGMASFGGLLRIPHLVRNGPIVFGSYQWTRNRNATTASALMPTQAERDGDFSQVRTPQGNPVTVFDPSTGQPFSGNAIPKELISEQAKALLKLYPFPNFEGSTRYNYQVPLVSNMHQDAFQSQIVKLLNAKNQLFGGFGMQSVRNGNPNVFGFVDKGSTLNFNASASWRRGFTTRLFGTLGIQFSRSSARTTPYFANRANISGEAGIRGNSQAPPDWGPPALMFASGIQSLSDAAPSLTRNQTAIISYTLLWNRARHTFTFGGDFRRQQFNVLSQQNPRGTFGFTGAAAGFDFAGFLLGVPDTSAVAFGNADKYYRASGGDAYFADDWRILSSLSLNLGLRWEYWAPATERYGRLVNLDIGPGFNAQAPVLATEPVGALTRMRYPDSLLKPDKAAIQPRLGFSWRPFAASPMVVRGGYGVYYNTSVYLPIAMQMAQQAPLSKSISAANGPGTPLTLANGFVGAPSIPTFAVDPSFRPGYVHVWQVSVQRDLPAALVLVVTYTGNKGTHGMQEFLPNTYPAGAVNPCPSCPTGFVYLTSGGNSSRQAAQVQLRRRLRSGLTADFQYTFAKALDNATLGGGNAPIGSVSSSSGAAQGFASQGGALIAQNWLDLRAERGRSNFDQRHLVALQVQYTTGMGIAGGTLVGGWKGALFKEWTAAAQLTAGSGLPLTPVYTTVVAGTGVSSSVRPDFTGAPVYSSAGGGSLNPGAYAAPRPGFWGNAGRNSITGPAQFSLNGSLGRTFRANDRTSFDLRVDATNVLNHVTFPSWNTNVTSSQFGFPVAANAMRSLQTTVRMRF
jgi:hypothetical protein